MKYNCHVLHITSKTADGVILRSKTYFPETELEVENTIKSEIAIMGKSSDAARIEYFVGKMTDKYVLNREWVDTETKPDPEILKVSVEV